LQLSLLGSIKLQFLYLQGQSLTAPSQMPRSNCHQKLETGVHIQPPSHPSGLPEAHTTSETTRMVSSPLLEQPHTRLCTHTHCSEWMEGLPPEHRKSLLWKTRSSSPANRSETPLHWTFQTPGALWQELQSRHVDHRGISGIPTATSSGPLGHPAPSGTTSNPQNLQNSYHHPTLRTSTQCNPPTPSLRLNTAQVPAPLSAWV
jgi:hypothetical protein